MKWEVVIGLETHAQLSTASKIFSGASTAFGAAPNTQASAVDIALPGVLPVLNRGAVERAIRFGLAVGATIHRRSVFARKNYFYPDLPKGYQISQYEIPIVQGGSLSIATPAGEKIVRLTRAHLEEDAGKSLHEDYHGMTGIDLNRAGTPLLEIVSEPDLRSAAEAVTYAKRLHALVKWIGICDGNMQEGSFRCDANVSVRRQGAATLGTRCEIKNLNSFRFMQQAIEYEVRRQIELIDDGGTVVQETRLFDPGRGETRSMRSKEDAQDYRYFPDPDLPPLAIDDAWIERVRSGMPELPEAMRERFVFEYALQAQDAVALTADRETARYFETAAKSLAAPVERTGKLVANWVLGELSAALNRDERAIGAAPVRADQLAALLRRIGDGTISGKIAKDVFDAMWAGEHAGDADAIIAAKGLEQISDAGAIERIVDDVLAANAAVAAEFRAGKEKALQSLVGKAMAATKGKRRPGAGQRGPQEEARGELTGRQSIVPNGRLRTERKRPTPMNILGMTGPALHDPSAALFVDGRLVAAAEEERFIRVKHAKRRQPVNAIKFCLAQAGIRPHEVDVVAYPYVHIGLASPARWYYARRHWYEPGRALRAIFDGNRKWRSKRASVLQLLDELGIGSQRAQFVPIEHHLAHASSAYHLSGFAEKTAIVSIDGKGEYATTFFGYGENGRIHRIKEFYDPDSLGWFYGALTEYLGFEFQDGEYKVMGMAPYGDPQKYDLSRLIRHDGASFRVNTRLVNVIGTGAIAPTARNTPSAPSSCAGWARCETATTSTSLTSTMRRPVSVCWKIRRSRSSTTMSATSSAKPASSASPAEWRSM